VKGAAKGLVPGRGLLVVATDAVKALRHAAVQVIRRTPIHAVVLATCLVWLIPSVGLLVSSIRPASDVATTGWWTAFTTPLEFTLQNYDQVITRRGLGLSFMNSLLVTIPATILVVIVAGYAAYAFAWMQFRGRDWLFLAMIAALVVPLQITLVPVLRLFNGVGLTGTFPGIWLAHLGYGLPFAIYLLRNFFAALPRDMFESAAIDGASHRTMFFRLALPTSVPAIASLAIFEFVWNWNDLLIALIYLGGRKDVAPLTVAITNLVASHGEGWQLLTSAAFISMALPLVVFFTLQRYFVGGILAGSVKG
jgi:alpha-glucoside transport system permease protein